MQFSVMQTEVRSRVREDSARLYTDAEINRWLNLAYKDFIGKTMWTERTKAYSVTANQFLYDLPSDYIQAQMVEWDDQFRLFPVDQSEFRSAVGSANESSSTRPYVYLAYPHDQKLRIYPGPSTASTSSTVSGAHNSSVTTITLADASSFPSSGRVILDGSEQVIYYAKSGNDLQQCVRGADFTTAASYSGGETAAVGQLTMNYVYSPVDLSADADIPRIPEPYHEALVVYAASIALQKRKDYQGAGFFLQKYAAFITQAMSDRTRQQMDRQWAIKDEDRNPHIYMGDF